MHLPAILAILNDNDSMAGRPPRSQSDMDSMAGRPPGRGVRRRIKVELSDSTDDSDTGQLATYHTAGNRADTSNSLEPHKDRYLIIFQKNVVPYVVGPINLNVDWFNPDMESTQLLGQSPNTASA